MTEQSTILLLTEKEGVGIGFTLSLQLFYTV